MTVLRRAARFIFTALLLGPFAFLAVARTIGPAGAPRPSALVLWTSVAATALSIALSRALPPRVRAAGASDEAIAFVRLLLAWAVCDAAILFPLVAHVVTADPWLLGVAAIGLLALVLLAPTEARWRAALVDVVEEATSGRDGLGAGRARAAKER